MLTLTMLLLLGCTNEKGVEGIEKNIENSTGDLAETKIVKGCNIIFLQEQQRAGGWEVK